MDSGPTFLITDCSWPPSPFVFHNLEIWLLECVLYSTLNITVSMVKSWQEMERFKRERISLDAPNYMRKMKRAKSLSSHGAVFHNERLWASTVTGGSVLERMCMSESTDREADMERCCIAQRPASVSRVVTTAETPRKTERQREEEGEEERVTGQKRRKIHYIPNRVETNACICCTTINSYYSSTPSTILPPRREHREFLILSFAEVSLW